MRVHTCELADPQPVRLTVSAPDYSFVGKRVRVHLYTHEGFLIRAIEGRVADISPAVTVGQDAAGRDIVKDLVYVVDIEPGSDEEGNPVPYKNSAGVDSEGWFAVQDVTVIEDGGHTLFAN